MSETNILKEHRIQDRARFISEAKGLPMLDAAFRVMEFNHRYNVPVLVPSIDFHREVFPSSSAEECDLALRRAGSLRRNATALGAAYHGYPGSPPLDAVLAEVKRSHPGFSEASYQSVTWEGAQGMR